MGNETDQTCQKRVEGENIVQNSKIQLDVTSVKALRAGELAVVKSSQIMNFQEKFMGGYVNKKLRESIGCLNLYINEYGLKFYGLIYGLIQLVNGCSNQILM